MEVYGHEPPSDVKDFHIASKTETEYPSISTKALVELLSCKSGNENMIQRYGDKAKGKRDGVSLDYQNDDQITSTAGYHAVAKSGSGTAERRLQMNKES
ncbi:hypothetical protein NPIL_271061 [Nephila pilipes]|uniref:RED-like N-terminal domain-containing protein n=1 Tax=Nephila pilipes TaxID=299642 RepID=A0A8X6QXX4_NEPPI|nr:hypothetical protein NPIL_271061 [Nephila pilipes]